MILIMLMIMVYLTLIFPLMAHPLSMGLILLIQTTVMSVLSSFLNYSTWFSYILFLIMVGGMLILFMYMTSIASSEKFSISLLPMPLTLMLIMSSPLWVKFSLNFISSNETSSSMNSMNIVLSFSKYINFPLMILSLMMMIYLFITLIVAVKITEFKMGSIRQMN